MAFPLQRHQCGFRSRTFAVVLFFSCLTCSSAASPETPASTPTPAPPTPAAPPDAFQSKIDSLFADDGVADIRVTFGYENYQELKDPCDPARARHFMIYLKSLGFEEVKPTEELAAELGVPVDVQNFHIFTCERPDGRKFRVSLMWSAATTSTARNIGGGLKDQLILSGFVKKFMQKSASEAEVMIYVGHSRGGGGPDTYPPEVLAGPNVRSQQVDFAWYRRNRPGVNALAPSFAKSETTPPIILWTGCLSHVHFGSWLSSSLGAKDHPTCLILSTRLISHVPGAPEITAYDEALMAAVNLLDALIWRPTQKAFEKRLLLCELDELRHPTKPAWKITNLPGKKAATEPTSVAAGQ